MHIIMVRHGRIDPSDSELLQAGNPHLDEDWRKENLPSVGEQLRGIPFTAVYCGGLYRSVETLQTLIASSDLPKSWITDEFIDDPSTYHDGVIYPDVRPSFIGIMDEIPSYFRGLSERHEPEADILMVGGAAKIICMIALSNGLKFQDEEEAQSWIRGGIKNEKIGFIETGSIHPFYFNPHDCQLRRVSLEEVRNIDGRRKK